MNQAQPLTQAKAKRYGLVALLIGASHMVTIKDASSKRNTVVQKTAIDKRRLKEDDESNDCKLYCFHCKEAFDSVDEMRSNHPDTYVMIRDQETHLYAWVSVSGQLMSEEEGIPV
jgi:hypothetical protein